MNDESASTREERPQRLLGDFRRTLKFLPALAVPVVAWFAYGWLTAPTLDDARRTVAELNRKLPSMVDKMTRLEKVTLDDEEIVYRYHLVGARADGLAGEDLRSVLEPQVRPAICSAPMLQALLRNGYAVRYQYYGDPRKFITEIVVRPGECGWSSMGGCALAPPRR